MSPVVEEPEEEIPQPRPWRKVVETPERVAESERPSIPVVGEPEEELPQPRPWRKVIETPEQVVESERPSIQQPNNKAIQSQSVSSQDPPTEDTSGWPAHMVDAKTYLTQEAAGVNEISVVKARDWGDGWIGCVQEFVDFQRRANFPDTGPSFPPATDVRPVQIATWMKNRRPWKDVEIDDKEAFGQQWWAWWSSLQPDSRIRKDKPTTDMDWSKLQKPGKNGFLLIMLALVWWGVASNRDGEWSRAVADVKDVLQCMREAVQESDKRGPLSGLGAANVASLVSSKRGRKEEAVGEGSSRKKQRTRR